MYTLLVRNKQAQKLSQMLNIKIDYKNANAKIISEHTYKCDYEYNRDYLTIPNEIDGKIVFEILGLKN